MSMALRVPQGFIAIPVLNQLATHPIGTPYELQNDTLISTAHSLGSHLYKA